MSRKNPPHGVAARHAALAFASTVAFVCSSAVATPAKPFSLSSPTVLPGATLARAQVFNGFGCTGDDISPALTWAHPPAATQSFALTMYDPDAPTGSGWWHWVVYNIPKHVNSLAAGAGNPDGKKLPPSVAQGRNDYGAYGFGGACPPAGDKAHRYIFTIYALDVDHLELAPDASAAMLGFMIQKHKLGSATLQAKYQR